MADLEVTKWFGDLVSHPRVIVDANSLDDIVAVMKDATNIRRQCERPAQTIQLRHAQPPTEALFYE